MDPLLDSIEGEKGRDTFPALKTFPPEVLASISDVLSPWEIGRLWFCGDKQLCRALKLGGVRKLDFEVNSNQANSFFPSLASEFVMLDSFRLSLDTYAHRSPTLDLTVLPNSLKSLTLRGFRLHADLVESDVLRHFTGLSVLKIPYHRACDEVMLLALPSTLVELRIPLADKSLDLVALPTPHLTRLSIWVQLPPQEGLSFVHLESLTDLKVTGKRLRFSSFPSTLTRFRTDGMVMEEDMPHFPTSLTSFSAVAPSQGLWSQYQWPQNLKTLSLHTALLDPVAPSTAPFQADSFSRLPTSITKLIISYEFVLPAEIVQFLPSTLLDFECGFRSRSRRAPQPMSTPCMTLPPQLTRLVVHTGDILFSELPSTLLVLGLPHFILTAKSSFKWPPRLDFFDTSVVMLDLNEIGQSENKLLLAPSIARLTLKMHIDMSLTRILPSKCLQSLHLDLTSLTETTKMCPSGWSSFLPSSLTSLTLPVPGRLLDDTWIMNLNLPNLQILHCPSEVAFSPSLAFSTLPRSLTHFEVGFPGFIDWSNHKIRDHLPNLRNLRATSKESRNISSNWISLLPLHLVRLFISCQATSFIDPVETVLGQFKSAHILLIASGLTSV